MREAAAGVLQGIRGGGDVQIKGSAVERGVEETPRVKLYVFLHGDGSS